MPLEMVKSGHLNIFDGINFQQISNDDACRGEGFI